MHSIKNDILGSLFPNGKYLTYSEGKSNVLLSAPHGGGMKPIHMPRRKYGTMGKDTYTRRLIEKLVIYLSPIKPYYVYSDIHRSRVDLNRDKQESAQGNYYAEKIWENWNSLLTWYTNDIRNKFNTGLYVDVHSHNDGNYFELGYNLSASNYVKAYSTGNISATTTIDSVGKYQLFDALFGEHSFHSQLKFYGYKPFLPYGDEVYFNGGRNIEQYNGDGIASIQIECPVSVLKHDLDNVAKSLALIITDFRDTFVV